jgi:uncharacterized cupin superfamily protein
MTATTKPLWTAAELAAAPEVHIRHPFNPGSDVYLRPLGRPTGLKRLSLSLARVPPGKESFIYHAHERDEEFLYIISGHGRALIGDEVFEVGPGDFMAFPTPSIAHHMLNPYEEDLVYLMGGEHSGFDIGTFPRVGKRVIFTDHGLASVDEADLRPMTFAEFLPDGLPEGMIPPPEAGPKANS